MGDTWPARKADLLLAGQGLAVVLCSCCGTHIQEQQRYFSSELCLAPQLILSCLVSALTQAALSVNENVNIKCWGGQWQL